MTYAELETRIEQLRQLVEDKVNQQEPAYKILKDDFDAVYNSSKQQIELMCKEFGIEPYIRWEPYIGMQIDINIHKRFPDFNKKKDEDI